MAQKADRMGEENRKFRLEITALQRDLAERKEEQEVMRNLFKEQLDDSARRIAGMEAQANLSQHRPPDVDRTAEATQLGEDLIHVREGCTRRMKQSAREVAALQDELQLRNEQLVRMRRVAHVMTASADIDLSELSALQKRAREMELENDNLESMCLKTHCQVGAWSVWLRELQRSMADAESEWKAKEKKLQVELSFSRAEVGRLQRELEQEKDHCRNLEDHLNGGQPEDGGATATLGHKDARERGVQTRYITEWSSLQEQLEELTKELGSLPQPCEGDAVMGFTNSWLPMCLRSLFTVPAINPAASGVSIPGSVRPASLSL